MIFPVSPRQIAELVDLILEGTISNKIARIVLDEMWGDGLKRFTAYLEIGEALQGAN